MGSISRAVRISESKDTISSLISSVVSISKLARSAISKSSELRNHDTRLKEDGGLSGKRDRQSGRGLSIEFFRTRRIEPGQRPNRSRHKAKAACRRRSRLSPRRSAQRIGATPARLFAPSLVSERDHLAALSGYGGFPGADDGARGDVGGGGGRIGVDRCDVGGGAGRGREVRRVGGAQAPPAAAAWSMRSRFRMVLAAAARCLVHRGEAGARAARGKQRCQRNRQEPVFEKAITPSVGHRTAAAGSICPPPSSW